ncbi:MAG: hypothetical protein ACD_12C00066G0001 [uncultured bacterium]|nr:MAG: hypothetical protein ACD_12C00066G0001 [uncultured bacterium]
MFSLGNKLFYIAVSVEDLDLKPQKLLPEESVEILDYNANNIRLATKAEFTRLLVLTDIYYPSWQVYIDGQKANIHKVDFALRGVIVPVGTHEIEFKINLL